MSYSRGTIIDGPDPFGGKDRRPYVILSGNRHPFNYDECICVSITGTKHKWSVPLDPQDFIQGGLEKMSYASPWVVTTFAWSQLRSWKGEIEQYLVNEIVHYTAYYMGFASHQP